MVLMYCKKLFQKRADCKIINGFLNKFLCNKRFKILYEIVLKKYFEMFDKL